MSDTRAPEEGGIGDLLGALGVYCLLLGMVQLLWVDPVG